MVKLRLGRGGFYLGLFAIAVSTAMGCGTGAYEETFKERLGVLKMQAPFANELGAAVTLPDTSIQIRVPKLFKDPPLEPGQEGANGIKIGALRVQPFAQVPIPGFKSTYETKFDEQGNEQLFGYCYLAALPTKDPLGENLGAAIQAIIKRGFPNFAEGWNEVEVDTPDGKKLKWKKCELNGEFPFEIIANGQTEIRRLPGHFEVWLLEDPTYRVLVGWRIPDQLKEKFDVEKLAKLTAGTIVIGPAPEAAAAEGADNAGNKPAEQPAK